MSEEMNTAETIETVNNKTLEINEKTLEMNEKNLEINDKNLEAKRSFQDAFKEYFKLVRKATFKRDASIDNNDKGNNNNSASEESGEGFQDAYELWLDSYEPKIL